MTEPAEGTYPITGSELSQVDCGVCVYLLGDLTIDALGRITAFDEVYFVDGGSVTISRIDTPAPGGGGPDAGVIDAGMVIDASPFDASAVDASTDADPIVDATPAARLAGSFTGLTFSQLDRMTFDPVPGGCRSAAAGGVFDAVLAP
jgi:hypothetical protein